MKRRLLYVLAVPAILLTGGCNKFLDELPDNRAELDSVEKVNLLLVSAYPNRSYVRMCELASDNYDDAGETNPNYSQLIEQNSYWMDMTIADNDSNVNTWQQYYNAIGVANTVLKAIEDLGTPDEYLPAKGEALMCRAYSHFCLTLLYCLPYHPEKGTQYLGIPYMDKPETTLNPEYSRGNVCDVYDKIASDIEEALPLIEDSHYAVPKYHFNRQAAYAFASRFYIYYMKWEKAVEAADYVLGSNAAIMLRNWDAVNKLPYSVTDRARDYIDPKNRFNLMMIPLYGVTGSLFNAWDGNGARFMQMTRVSKQELFRSKRPMGGPVDTGKDNYADEKTYRHVPLHWNDNVTNKTFQPKWFPQWEVSDAVTGTGYSRCTFVAFTTNEVLLNRAEAYIHLKKYDEAIKDLQTWEESYYKVGQNGIVLLTRERIAEVYGDPSSSAYIPEYTVDKPTSRKRLFPHGFTVESGEQENMIQCLLYCRRIDSLGDGLRWGDIKRYGIEVNRMLLDNYVDGTTTGYRVAATLSSNDLRRAFQLPQDVVSAGIDENPRDDYSHPFVQQ
ncbi:MAG: RagB/SusD family nutrient uptake outer membrane protein [Bacteroidales bacterium]|nr:RagB/SusD family nutrient uptake outer membrane protein [Bacteroides sp.]MCM1197417.1 RagB/SusD family nutrient uptake outer membrane protein [Clostridium sp.]MCM1502907.1 RagB/SusD family nutrient uptake outer membrane protein [Bacteroidales bacterium]